MRVTVSITFSPDLPEHRTVEAESTFEAVRSILAEEDTQQRFSKCVRKGGGNVVISAFPARPQVDYKLHSATASRTTVGGPLFQ